jgi:hypothetical protein
MADNAAVEVVDDGVVTIDLTANPDLAPPEPEDTGTVVVETPPKPRQRQKAAADTASEALTEAVKAATAESDTLRRAAEATALSERQRAEAAHRLAAQREEEAKGYREQAESSQLTIINSGIERHTNEIASYTSEMERAFEAGEFGKATAAQVKMAKSAAALDRLEADKVAFESGARKAPTTEGRVEAPPVHQSPFEQYVSGFDPKAQAWLRAHPECVPSQVGGDATKNAKMMAGHYDALAKGIQPNSEAYFQAIEEHTGHRQPVEPVSRAAEVVEAGETPPPPKPKARQAAPSAPVSRDAPGPNGVPTSRTVNLTKEQQEIALLAAGPMKDKFGNEIPETPEAFKRRAFGTYAVEYLKAVAEDKLGPRRRGDIYG